MAIDLTRYPVLMLDMNGTFMFGQDRFGPLQDYHATYLALGGQRLSAADLSATIGDFVATMSGLYRTPGLYDAFPSVAEVLQLGPDAKSLGPVELALLEAVIAQHERGTVPVAQAQAITRLAQSHDLILMSSIWSRKDIWLDHLNRTGVLAQFKAAVFSSDHGCIKPGRRIYDIALAAGRVSAAEVAFIGDDPLCDTVAPRNLGMATLRVRGSSQMDGQDADWVISDLGAILG